MISILRQLHPPLYVDLDGTLIKGDTFIEGILRLVHRNPLNAFLVLIWLFKGRSFAKEKVAASAPLTAEMLNYNHDFVDYLKSEKAAGRTLYLATAAPQAYADIAARDIDLFDGVLATTVNENLKGSAKAAKIRIHTKGARFAYAGDSSADLKIWAIADQAVTVGAAATITQSLQENHKLERAFPRKITHQQALCKAMRSHQWAKNLLIFLPLGLSHQYTHYGAVLDAGVGFIAFSLCASGVYLLNDLLDLEADRRHVTKRNRPLAAGTLPIASGVAAAAVLPTLALLIGLSFLSLKFVAALMGYYALTNAYSLFLKRKPTADVLTLAVLYTIRIVAGGLAINVALTSWLLGFSTFLFLSLAYLKRYIELADRDPAQGDLPGRGYSATDTEGLFTFGVGAMYASSVVLAIYIDSTFAATTYSSPEILWVLCLILIFWGNRIWTGARRGIIHEDPIVFAIKDQMSRFTGLAMVATVLTARYL